MRRRYRWLLRDEVAHTVGNPADVEDELRHLCRRQFGTKPDNDSHAALLGFGFPKMNFYGLSDSLATITRQPNECPHCHAAVRVSNGLRLGCFLQAGLTEDEDPYLAEIFNFFRHFSSPFPEKEMRDMGKTPAVQILTISNVPSDILEAIDELAARQDRSRSSFVRRELQRIVAEYQAKEALSRSR